MALLETNDTIKEYYNEVKDLYPDISFEQFQDICKQPFKFFKSKIEQDDMPNIDIKYFGKFRVFAASIKGKLKELETKKHFNQISDERYDKFKANLETILKKIQDNDDTRRNKKNNKGAEQAD